MINQETKGARLQTISCFSQKVQDVTGREVSEHQPNAIKPICDCDFLKCEHPTLKVACQIIYMESNTFSFLLFSNLSLQIGIISHCALKQEQRNKSNE